MDDDEYGFKNDCDGTCWTWDMETLIWAANVGLPVAAAGSIIDDSTNNWVFHDTVDFEERYKRNPKRMNRIDEEGE